MRAATSSLISTASGLGRDYNPLGKLVDPEVQPPFSVLSVGFTPEDYRALCQILDGVFWQVSAVSTCREAVGRISTDSVSVVVCESVLEDGSWKSLLECTRDCPNGPPLIVTSRMADAFLWSEVLNLGGYDVLAKPFSDREVLHVLNTVILQEAAPGRRARVAGAC